MLFLSVLFLFLLGLTLLGIQSRLHGLTATFWPVNAVLLGVLLKRPSYATQARLWLCAALAYISAESLSGQEPIQALLLCLIQLLTVGLAFYLLSKRLAGDINLRQPKSLFTLIIAVAIASGVGALLGGLLCHHYCGEPYLQSALYWFIAEQLAYTALVPVILCAPSFRHLALRKYRFFLTQPQIKQLAPIFLLLLSAILSLLLGGAGAVAFPVLPLLWCALRYSLFTTSLLTLLFITWTLSVTSLGLLPTDLNLLDQSELISMRLGVASIALAPLITASITASRNDAVEKLRYLAQYDALTGLLNKQAFYEKAHALLIRPCVGRLPISVLVLDIDHFKPVNDNFGHAAGDQVLHVLTQRLQEELRDSDLAGRLGGEEFGVVLTDCSPTQALNIAERIRSRIARGSLDIMNDKSLHLTVSIGIACHQHGSPVLKDLLRKADKALYRAKRNGRNRSHIYNPKTDETMLA